MIKNIYSDIKDRDCNREYLLVKTIWHDGKEDLRFIVQTSADWAQVTISDITQKTQSNSDRRDPMYVLHGIKKN